MSRKRLLPRSVLTRLLSGVINRSGKLILQAMPLSVGHAGIDVAALRRDWIAGDPKGNDRDLVRMLFLAGSIAALQRARVPGAFAELGVWRGNSAKVISRLAPDRLLYLLDTFSGFAPDDAKAEQPGGPIMQHFVDTSVEQVRRFLGASPLHRFIVGRFPDTAAQIPAEECFAFVHLDCDLYAPIRASLEFFYPRLSPGGMIVVHDYASGRWPGVTQAVDDFLADKPESLILIPDTSGTAAFTRVDPRRANGVDRVSRASSASASSAPECFEGTHDA
jgi:hypothetical protein